MNALVLHGKNDLRMEDFPIEESFGEEDVRIRIQNVGICGSDIHYYLNGKIGSFVVNRPMILGHEASGIVEECGSGVTHLKPGDRVCMEPGIPDSGSMESRSGLYNLDPAVRFWATPPVHGCLRPRVVHPASFTFPLPDNISDEEGAMVEPLAIGVYAASRAGVTPGDVALVTGAGTIGLCCVVAALAAGCSHVIVTDVLQPKLELARCLGSVSGVNPIEEDLGRVVRDVTGERGVDVVFEASGHLSVYEGLFSHVRTGGRVVVIGMPPGPAPLDVAAAQVKEALIIPIFRYRNAYPRTLALLGSGAIDVKPLISRVFPFNESLDAFQLAVEQRPDMVKIQIRVGDET